MAGVTITSRRYYGRRKPFFGGRMAEWLRPADCEVLTIKLHGIIYQFVHLVSTQKSIGWADGVKIMSRRYYGRRKPLFFEGQDGRVVKASGL